MIYFLLVILSMVVIWKACDGFEEGADYLGRNLSDGVKGATINAIGSSLPEFFAVSLALLFHADKEGFAFGVGTTAGSAVFNSAVIPAVVLLAVTLFGAVRVVTVSRKVVMRDGFFLIMGEIILIMAMNDNVLSYGDGAALILWYMFYMVFLFKTMKTTFCGFSVGDTVVVNGGSEGLITSVQSNNITISDMTTKKAWGKLLVNMSFIGASCYILVESCYKIGELLEIETYFVAVILAAGATSVPDTILSLKDAMKGDYDDAISNALGSNIFDICICLGLPLFVYCIYTGESIQMQVDMSHLRIALLGITSMVFVVLLRAELTFKTGLVLLSFYGAFVLFIINKVYNLFGG